MMCITQYLGLEKIPDKNLLQVVFVFVCGFVVVVLFCFVLFSTAKDEDTEAQNGKVTYPRKQVSSSRA